MGFGYLIEETSLNISVWAAMILAGTLLVLLFVCWRWFFRSANNFKITFAKRVFGVLITVFLSVK